MNKVGKLAILAAAALPAYLYAKALKKVPLSFVRFRNGGLQTPILRFEHPITKRRITLVGVIHIADAPYFKAIQEAIDESRDDVVLYESVKPLEEWERSTLTKREQEALAELEQFKRIVNVIADICGLTFQKDAMSYRDSWINADISTKGLVEAFAKYDVRLLPKESSAQKLMEGGDLTKLIFHTALAHLVPIIVAVAALTPFTKNKKKEKNIVLDKRNKIALHHIASHTERDITTIWGAAHLPGITRGIKRLGYAQTSKEWLTAYEARKIKINIKRGGTANAQG